ncbi:hypothetical protein AB0B66_23860 [Catellatospora sp. NPDC049111]|uniref:hypothetical protein n=1 Tax=Catellatospora sp. NPDC049111 TaxID=3155271 RepID=UPI0033ED070A
MQSALNQPTSSKTLPQRLAHVYWIGGGSGSGKSTIARRLADQYGLSVYNTDAAMPEHARRMPAETAPYLRKFADMDMNDRWVNRAPADMLETFHWYHGEGFEQIISDLLNLPTDQPVIAEGFRLLPDLVQPLLAERRRAVWLLPSPQFRRDVFDSRGGTTWGFIAKTSDPQRALQNLLERDAMFTDRLAQQTTQLSLTALAVDVGTGEDDLVQQVAGAFGLDG